MAASLATAPPEWAYSKDPIFVEIETDLIDTARATLQIVISGTGPSAGQLVTINYTGGSITYTAGGTPTADGLTWPLKNTDDSLTQYCNYVEEFLNYREEITTLFQITRPTTTSILLTRKVTEVFSIVVAADTMANVAFTATPVASITTPDNLRAVLSVHSRTAALGTDERLYFAHATYDNATARAAINISPAFVHLQPEVPPSAQINPDVPAFASGTAPGHLQQYYLRLADKYGTPPVSDALVRDVGYYFALLGARAGDARLTTAGASPLLHNYRRRDGGTFAKPVSHMQPDWVYWLPQFGEFPGTAWYVSVLVKWSDGTTSVSNPFGTADRAFVTDQVNFTASGFMQLNLHTLAPSGSTAADAVIVGYDFRIMAKPSNIAWITVSYEIETLAMYEHVYLLFENGVGGLETCWLHGARQQDYTSAADEWRRYRSIGHSAVLGDMATLNSEGQPAWKLSTGLYDRSNQYYLQHLQQLRHAAMWLIDIEARMFLRVMLDGNSFEGITKTDANVNGFSINLKAAWMEQAWNA